MPIRLVRLFKTVEGATSPQVERVSGLPQINVEYDRTRLANYGINVEDVNNVVSTAFAGKSAGWFSKTKEDLIWWFV